MALFIDFYMEMSHLIIALIAHTSIYITLHGVRAGWVQLTAYKASLLLCVGFLCNRMW